MPSEASMPDPDMRDLYEHHKSHLKSLLEQKAQMEKHKAALELTILELMQMIEMLTASTKVAESYFPQPADPSRDPESAHNYARGLGS